MDFNSPEMNSVNSSKILPIEFLTARFAGEEGTGLPMGALERNICVQAVIVIALLRHRQTPEGLFLLKGSQFLLKIRGLEPGELSLQQVLDDSNQN
jgi:hypothetical protein